MKLFFSYSRKDREVFIRELAETLQQEIPWFDVWIDQRLIGGDMWWETILQEIETADCFVAILTPRYFQSPYCKAELKYALNLNKPILPLVLKDVSEIPDFALLADYHFVDISNLELLQVVIKCVIATREIENRPHKPPVVAPERPRVPRSTIEINQSRLSLTMLGELKHRSIVRRIVHNLERSQIICGERDGRLQFWDINTLKHQKTLDAHSQEITALRYNHTGTMFASGSADHTIKLWTPEGELSGILTNDDVVSDIDFSPDGNLLASASCWNNTVTIWNLESQRSIHKMYHPEVNSVVFRANGETLFSGGVNVLLWDSITGEQLEALDHTKDLIDSLTINPDDTLLVFERWEKAALGKSYEHREILVWSIVEKRPWYALSGARGIAFSSTGKLLATGNQKESLEIWEIETGQKLYSLLDLGNTVAHVMFGHEDRLLISVGLEDSIVKVWTIDNNA